MNKMNKKGFTLIEMLVVIAIIAVLVSIIIPVVGNSTTKARAATDAANLRSAKASLTIAVMNGDLKTGDTDYPAGYGTAPTAKSEGASAFAFTVESNGDVKVNFGEGKDIDYFAYIAENGKPKE